ncbi:hypothetical protein H4582DRAFT_1222471 [Lactarius indigo]|nr:hypothetical protein H4582DRAFT_1222471 [Lactarius indigo]
MDIVIPRRTKHRGDPEQGEQLPLGELGEDAQPETLGINLGPKTGEKVMDNSPDGPSRPEARSERRDFDDGANALWSLYNKEAQTHDEAVLQGISADMNGVPTFAGLFAAVLTSFLVDSLKNLQPDPAQQSVYYQQQSVAMLAQISQQIASIAPQVSVPSTPPPPYPVFHPSKKDLAVNSLWVIGLIYSLGAALLAIFIQLWVRSYMGVFEQYDHPLKRSRLRQIFFDDTRSVKRMANYITASINSSVILFFLGLSISTFNINNIIGGLTTFYILVCVSLPMQSILRLRGSLSFFPISGEELILGQEQRAMEESGGRKDRDVRAIQWLIDRTTANAEIEPLVLAIPGSFNTEWGQDVWKQVSSQAHDTPEHLTGPSPAGSQVSLTPHSPHPPEAAAVDTISRSVRYLFRTCNNHSYFQNEEARRRRMRVCVEATALLVCCIDYRLDLFGDVAKLVSEIGHIEKINQSLTTTSDPSFILRWTCLSLVDIQQILSRNRLKGLAGSAVIGLARFQSEHGQPDEAGREGAHRIDEYLMTAWERVEDLRRAFGSWTQKRTKEQVEEILLTHEQQISDLERIKSEADRMEDVDRQISLYQDAMDDATHGLMRQLPGVSFDEPHRSESFLIRDIFNTRTTGSAPVTPQLILPGQQLRALAKLGLQLREILHGEVEGYEEVLQNLKSVDKVPVSLRRPDDLMKRQLWRLQDTNQTASSTLAPSRSSRPTGRRAGNRSGHTVSCLISFAT